MKLRRVAPAIAGAPYASGCLGDETDGALLDTLGDLAGERVLVLGPHIGIMCELIRRGCREVTELELNERLDVETVDLVVIPSIGNTDGTACAIAHARRALTPSGRILVRTTADPSGRLARAIERTLRLHGFSAFAVRRAMDRTVFTAKLPPSGSFASS